jgi:hypothetical protein
MERSAGVRRREEIDDFLDTVLHFLNEQHGAASSNPAQGGRRLGPQAAWRFTLHF